MKYLVKNGADHAAVVPYGYPYSDAPLRMAPLRHFEWGTVTPLQVAVQFQHRDVAAYLIDHMTGPVDLGVVGAGDWDGDVDFVRWLYERGDVTFSLQSQYAYRALWLAVRDSDEEFVEFLLQAGTPPKLAMTETESPEGEQVPARWLSSQVFSYPTNLLHVVASTGNERIAKLLIAYGEIPTTPGHTGESPIEIARDSGHASVYALLKAESERLKKEAKVRVRIDRAAGDAGVTAIRARGGRAGE